MGLEDTEKPAIVEETRDVPHTGHHIDDVIDLLEDLQKSGPVCCLYRQSQDVHQQV